MQLISTPNAPKPIGHYAQAVVSGGLIFVSGQLAFDPKTGDKIIQSIEAETIQVLANIEAILEAAGSKRSSVIKATVYLSDMSFWAQVNQVYAAFFGSHTPARAIVPIKELPAGFRIEVEVVGEVSA